MEYPKPITSIDDLPQRYGGVERERFWQQYWKDCGVYDYDPNRPRDEVYSVDTPPPTVSGALHIGHVYSYTHTDFSVRYQRMAGKHIFYPFGFDDNGLPSERLVERVTGKRAHEVGREEFIKLCKPILEQAEQEFKDLWQSLALSCDWSQFYTTIDARSRAISQASFIDLYNKGYIYRKEAPTMWCWVDQTAIAQAEIEDKEIAGHFHDITFHIDDGSGKLTPVTIATTRPELIPACVAVFAHPDDERYKHLFGKKAITPLFEVEVPILPSVKADPEKGTGILMCCTFGDTDDVEHWNEFNLPTRVCIQKDGTLGGWGAFTDDPARDCSVDEDNQYSFEKHFWLSSSWPSRNPEQAYACCRKLARLKIKQGRERIRELLKEAGLLTKVEEITHIVRHSERGGVPIEILVTPQWYINLLDHKDELIAQGRKVKWHPEHMFKRFEHWVEGLNQDWCVSRQRYNGVPFPVWYSNEGKVILASTTQLPVNPIADKPEGFEDCELGSIVHSGKLGSIDTEQGSKTTEIYPPLPQTTITPEADVMDTWATSSLTPLLCTYYRIGAATPEEKHRHDSLYPMDLRPQAHDIIRTWAFYTITKAYYHFGVIPWKDIVISGHAQDVGRKKITKSKGHVVTPAEMVEKYSADGLRYWAAGCKLGTDTLYDEKNLTEGKRLITKLFNATKFALRHLLDFDPAVYGAGSTSGVKYDLDSLLSLVTYPTDKWMLEKLRHTVERATKAHGVYEFGDAKQAAEDFFWADFCDNYLELCKGRLYGEELALRPHEPVQPDGTKTPVDMIYTPEQLRLSAQAALFLGLSAVLKLFAPILPHICEECWSWYYAQWTDKRSIHEAQWPEAGSRVAEDRDLYAGTLLVRTIEAVRKWKSERNVSQKKPLKLVNVYQTSHPIARTSISGTYADIEFLIPVLGDLCSTANSSGVGVMVEEDYPAEAATSVENSPVAVVCELAEDAE